MIGGAIQSPQGSNSSIDKGIGFMAGGVVKLDSNYGLGGSITNTQHGDNKTAISSAQLEFHLFVNANKNQMNSLYAGIGQLNFESGYGQQSSYFVGYRGLINNNYFFDINIKRSQVSDDGALSIGMGLVF